VFPGGSYTVPDAPYGSSASENFGVFVRILGQMEQQPMYNSVNFNLQYISPENITIAGVKLNSLVCPSDSANPQAVDASQWWAVPPGTWMQQFTSYAVNVGTWNHRIRTVYSDYAQRLANMNGVIYGESSVRLADITDGTSNTLMFSEHAHAILVNNANIAAGLNGPPFDYQWWHSGYYNDSQIETQYPPNGQNKFASTFASAGSDDAAMNASSYHPGGVNAALCDGSVRFIKDTINSWAIDPISGLPSGITYTGHVYSIAPGTYFGTWQRLSTRTFGEVISADSF
jgi:prepilin-type processing-associated H-X9-DG protein